MTSNVAASVRARLLNKARQSSEEFELVLVRYACERFLYRLGASTLRGRFVLKGAGLLVLWLEDPYRATRDLDFLAHGPSDDDAIRSIVEEICAEPCTEDGLVFNLDSLEIFPIRPDEEYQGQRSVLHALLGKARIRLQIDFGFGGAVTPDPEEVEYPTMLPDLPAPRLRVYRREVTIAEKFEAMVVLGRRNSRMKDFHDVWALSSTFEFDGPILRQAIVACFERRRTEWTSERPDVLTSPFYSRAELADRWDSYLRTGAYRVRPPTAFDLIGERIRLFLGPLRDSVISNESFDVAWGPGGPWTHYQPG